MAGSNRLVRYTKEETDLQLRKIAQNVHNHVGSMVLVFREERRKTIPQLMKIESYSKGKVTLSKQCYDPLGLVRSLLHTCISVTDIYCGQVKLEYFDKDI